MNLREYLALPEYANVLTKMFGATCPRDATCAESASCGCSRTQRCHAYRNASLGEAHVAAAVANLRAHRAFGVQEAFNGAGKECDIPNFKGASLGCLPLVSANFWTSDHPSERF